MSEEETTVVTDVKSESIVEIAKGNTTEKIFDGEVFVTCFCKICSTQIRNQKAEKGFVECPKCKNKNKA